MSFIEAKLLQSPVVLKDGEQVIFPFRKAEALFYYLLVKEQATRDELVNLLWGEEDEETARKNLRHAMYKIRKAFDMDIIVSPQKSVVMLNRETDITTDVQGFLENGEEALDAYKGEFMQGFLLKDGEKFEEWVFRTREQLRSRYLTLLHERIEEHRQKNELKKVEYYGKLLLDEDPFDESVYCMLMECYGGAGAFHKASELYSRLEEILERELGIMPDQETRKAYEAVLAKRKQEESKGREKNSGFFYGRSSELDAMREQYAAFVREGKGRSFLLIGEAGIGKTKLKERFLEFVEGTEVYVLQTQCYQAEEDYPFKPWNQIFGQLADIIRRDGIEIPSLLKNITAKLFPIFSTGDAPAVYNATEHFDRVKYQLAEDAILEILKKVSKIRKVLLVIEDLHWMDGMSLRLLGFILRSLGGSGILMAATCRNSFEKRVEQFITVQVKEQLLEKIRLARFTKTEVAEFIEQALPRNALTGEMKERIYEETEGNAFFLAELLNTVKEKGVIGEISGKAQDILKSRIVDIPEDGMKLLYIASLFFDRVDLELLQAISGKDDLTLLDGLEILQKRYILKEYEKENEIYFEFTHHKLREFVYNMQSPARKKILHNRTGQILEKRLKNDYRDKLIYSRLIYHFTNGGNKLAALKYRIKNLNDYSDFSHELFPVLEGNGEIPGEGYAFPDVEEYLKQLKELEKQLEDAAKYGADGDEITRLEIAFYHTKGRYCIQEGEYLQGVEAIRKMIECAEKAKDYVYMIKGCRQMVYYGIQVCNTELMQAYLTKGLQLAEANRQIKERGILLRLQGLQKLMSEQYDEAEETLKQSIHIFEALNKQEDRYALNIAAAYNYMGEIRRYNMKFSSALHFYDKAMALCDEKKIFKGITLFNTNAGQAAFDMGDYSRAKGYFQKALRGFRLLDALMGRSTAEGYMALLLLGEGRYQEALESLKRAEQYAGKLKSPYESGLVFRVKAEIKGRMENNPVMHELFKAYLPLSVREYCEQGIALLAGLKNCYEIEILRVLM